MGTAKLPQVPRELLSVTRLRLWSVLAAVTEGDHACRGRAA